MFHFMPKSKATTCGWREERAGPAAGASRFTTGAVRVTLKSGFNPGSQVNDSRGITSRARSRPISPGLWRALATRLASSRSVVDSMPFIAPRTRVSLTRARVSIPSMPMIPCSRRKASSDPPAR